MEPAKYYILNGFFRKGLFRQNDFPLRGEGYPPNSAKDKFCQKSGSFGPKAVILAFFVTSHGENFRRFSVNWGGEYPPFPLSFFGQNDFPLRGWGGSF